MVCNLPLTMLWCCECPRILFVWVAHTTIYSTFLNSCEALYLRITVKVILSQTIPNSQYMYLHIFFSLLFESVNCMSDVRPECMTSDMSQIFDLFTTWLSTSRPWTKCLAKERDCGCGGYGIMALQSALSPYSEGEAVCQ